MGVAADEHLVACSRARAVRPPAALRMAEQVIRGHRTRPGVGGPNQALRIGMAALTSPDEPPVLPVAALTSLVRDTRCEGCLWPVTCKADRTCWRDEPASHAFTGALQARAVAAGKPRKDAWTKHEVVEAVRAYGAQFGQAPIIAAYGQDGLPSATILYRHFGSNADAAKAAGLTPRMRWGRKHKKAGRQW